MARFYVKALWDAEAGVYYSETDVPGLVVEARSIGEFETLVMELAPDLLAENAGIRHASVSLELSSQRELAVDIA